MTRQRLMTRQRSRRKSRPRKLSGLGSIARGDDDSFYISLPNSKGFLRWVKLPYTKDEDIPYYGDPYNARDGKGFFVNKSI
mgnify:CR=1 FL=1